MRKDAIFNHPIDLRSDRVMPEPNSGCWLWLGATNGPGSYGLVRGPRGSIMAHRLAWERSRGPIPDGMFVCHRCDNPLCVNPDHLFLGTPDDNMQDKVRKSRQSRGERHAKIMRTVVQRGEGHVRAKLTERQVREIRASSATNLALSEKYGVSDSMISYIRHRVFWRHVV